MSTQTWRPVALPSDIPNTFTEAGYTLASEASRSTHGQLCPVWVRRAHNADIGECNCWILRNAMHVTRIVAAVLNREQGEQPGARP